MSKERILHVPAKVADVSYADLYDTISDHWERKAEALQVRRWRALKRAVRGSHYAEHH